jgi:two-component system, cell cycle sensor histidine kinase and response regulator CckA
MTQMDQDKKTNFGRTKSGCHAQAVVMAVFLWCLQASASSSISVWAGSGASLSFVAGLSASQFGWFYGSLFAILLALLAAVIARWLQRWRRRALRRRDEATFQLIDEWTKSLQQEVVERKQAERALQESQETIMRQERLAAVGQLTAGLAHEFNNSMTIVQGHASLLMDNPNLDEESIKSLAHITDSVERMAKLVRQMLAFSRKQVLQQKPLDVRETMSHTSDMLGRLLGEQVTLRVEIAPHLPSIMADPEMFQQIAVNLVVNARDAMSSGGQLTIRAAEANFTPADIPAKSERKAGRYVRLSVTDTGSGMDTTIINHLFEPFFTTKEVGQGPGLGLATVYGMVNQHKGWIEVESKVGQGTTFDLYFPVTEQAPERTAEPVEPPKVRGGEETVLVVEDELVLRELVREILTVHGYRVLEAANGREALRLWQEHRENVDLLLTDMAMPHGISGRDLAEKMRQDAPQLPVIFSSGYSQEMIERNEDAVEDTAFLAKPYHPAQLAQTVRQALDAVRKPETTLAARAS